MTASSSETKDVITAALLAPALSSPLLAATKPYTGPIRVLVGFPPGGATDVVARAIVDKLGKAMNGQVFVIDGGAILREWPDLVPVIWKLVVHCFGTVLDQT